MTARLVPLRRVARFAYGDALASETRTDGAVPVMSSGGVTGSHSEANTLAPAIVIGRKGTFGSVHWSDAQAFVIDTAYYVDARQTAHDLRWLYWVLKSLDFASTSQDVGVPGLSRDAAYGLPCPVPPDVQTQCRIADFLDDHVARIDEAIRLRQEQMEALEDRFALTLHQCFDPSQVTSVPLRRVVAGLQTGSTPTVDEVQQGDDTIDWYTPNSFGPLARLNGPMKHFPSELTRANGIVRFQAPAVLFVGIGWASGRVAYLDRPGSGNQQLTAIYPSELIRPRFLLWQLHRAGPHIRRIAPFTVLPVLSNDFLKSVPIVLPDLATQDKTVALIEGQSELLIQLRTEAAAQIGLLESRRRSLITAAVTGEFDVSTASDREVVA